MIKITLLRELFRNHSVDLFGFRTYFGSRQLMWSEYDKTKRKDLGKLNVVKA